MRTEKLERRDLLAGPYAPAAGTPGSTAIDRGDSALVGWASTVVNYTAGSNVDPMFQTSDKALGPASGTGDDAVSLGRGGSITLAFEHRIRDGLGSDFAVFENSFSDTFLELGFVEVSSDGVNFFRFANDSLTTAAVNAFGAVDPTNVHNLAGKYRQGFGTPFDLEELRGVSPLLDTTRVSHVRIVDVVGDGNVKDSSNRPIYDPYPTVGSAGFDLDAIGVLHQLDVGEDVISFEDLGATLDSGSAFIGPDPDGTSADGPFDDVIVRGSFQSEQLEFNNTYSLDYGSWNQWAYSNVTNNVTPGYSNQFGVFAGGGGNGTATFGVGFFDQSDFFQPPTIVKAAEDVREFSSLLVSNTTYAALSMRDGDSFAKRFGGASGNDEDFLLLTITGKDGVGQSVGSVDFYLADYRFSDNTLDYIVDEWVEIDLRPLGKAKSLEFAISSSDTGPFGINTPAYFAVDEITMRTPAIFLDIADQEVSESAGPAATLARVSRASRDVSSAIHVEIGPVDATIASLPSFVTIPAGQPYVEFPIGAVDNDVVHGDRPIVIRAAAEGMLGSEASLLIKEDDQLALTFEFNSPSLVEGGSATATVHRNDADLSKPLVVEIMTSEPSLFAFNSTLSIGVGKSSAVLTVSAVDDALDRPDAEFAFSASKLGYVEGTDSIRWIDNDSAELLLAADQTAWSESLARPTAGFEDLGRTLAPESYYNGSDLAGAFVSGDLSFNNDYDPSFASWSGWSFSNKTDSTTAGYENQYSAFVGGGAAGSDTYAVAAAFGYPALPSIHRDPDNSTAFHSIEITNTTYAALSMSQGDGFAKKFGGDSGEDPDWLVLTIEGFDRDQEKIGSVDFYMADYRFSDNSLDYIVDQWTEVSLDSISEAVELRFSMSSSDVGQFGMNTPAYFAADNVTMVGNEASPTVTLSRNSFDLGSDLQVRMVSSDVNELRVPAQVVIPAGSATVTVPIEIINDDLVDGTKVVQLTASADSFGASMLNASVLDDDLPVLTLTLAPSAVEEAGGVVQAVVHRNRADLSSELVVQLGADSVETTMPSEVIIPAGSASLSISFGSIDNQVRDGDRTVTIQASADGDANGVDQIVILDDEQSGLMVAQSGESTSVAELREEDDVQVSLSVRPLSNVVVSIRSDSEDFDWSPSKLTFTPDNWSQPQTIVVRGTPDLLIEGDELQELIIEVDPSRSDSLFTAVAPSRVEVKVLDRNPSQLRIGEDLSDVFLVDEESGVRILSHPHADGIRVVGNVHGQSIQLDALARTRGLIEVETDGGDDTVILRGGHFTFLDGGDGFDSLVLNLDEAVDFAAFLEQRVARFEQYVLASDSASTVLLGSGNLESVASADGSLLVRVLANQSVAFSSGAVLVEPRMHADEFAQVVKLGEYQFVLISETPWQNIRSPFDVNGNGEVTSLDALAVINELGRRDQPELPEIRSLDDFHGFYYDVFADGSVTALDALRVINELARRELGSELEWIPNTETLATELQSTRTEQQSDVDVQFAVSSSPLFAASKTTAVASNFDQVLQQSYGTEIESATNIPDEAQTVDLIDAALVLLSDF